MDKTADNNVAFEETAGYAAENGFAPNPSAVYTEAETSENISILRKIAVIFSVVGVLASLIVGFWMILGKELVGQGCIVSIIGTVLSCVFGIACFMFLDMAEDVRKIRIILEKNKK